MIPVYRYNGSYLQRIHPAAQTVIIVSFALIPLVSENPLIQVAVILGCGFTASASGVFREWLSWWKICVFIGLMSVIINPLVSREGATVIWTGPHLPVFGRLDITLEAILYGLGMGLRLSAIIMAFALFSLIVDPDRILGLLRGRGSRSALFSALSMKMIPTAMRDAGDILDAQRSRGIAKDSGVRLTVLKSRIPVLGKLVSTSLDRAVCIAEAMESRAYGSGSRTRYHEYRFGGCDAVLLAASIAMVIICSAGPAAGWFTFAYYPDVSLSVSIPGIIVIVMPVLLSLALLLLSWLWRRWAWLKLRI